MQPGMALDDVLAPYASVDRSPTGACWVMAHMVGGLDGSAAVGGRVGALSTAPDANLFRLMRSLADVVLVGAETVRREGYGAVQLTAQQQGARAERGQSLLPRLAIVTRSLDLDWSAKAFTNAAPPACTVVITCADAPPDRLEVARQAADVLIAGQDRVEPAEAMRRLGELGHRMVLCEGGPTWLGEVVAADLLDELCLTIAPMMGGDPLPVSVSPVGAPLTRFALQHVLTDGDTLFLRYERAHE
jgi:riboflavin biosynthesis pyrimidine reductase